MYHQINATEMFRERRRTMLEQGENERLARRLRVAKRSTQEKGVGHLRRAALLFAAVAVALLISATAALAAYPGANGKIVFTSDLITDTNPTGDYEIFSMNKDGTGKTQLTENTAYDSTPPSLPSCATRQT